MDEVARLGLMIGDSVIIRRAGDVIPQVMPGNYRANARLIARPVEIPSIARYAARDVEATSLIKPWSWAETISEGACKYRCVGRLTCQAQLKQAKSFIFVSRRGAGLSMGWVKRIVEQLVDIGLVSFTRPTCTC